MNPFNPWDLDLGFPPLLPQDIQVWRIDLDQDEPTTARFRRLLSTEERERADRFYFPHLRTHFTVARAALRILLAAATGHRPGTLVFAYAQHGKPYLPGSDTQFNLSHSGALALVALTRQRRVGIDLELVRDLTDVEAVARRSFSRAEFDEFLACPPEERMQAFFNCWTRKEAFIKAIGEGLSCPLDSFRVSLIPREPARIIHIQGDPKGARKWELKALAPGPGYAGALMAEGKNLSMTAFDFRPPTGF